MKILVTGGAGFIGSHLVERLVKEGHNVSVLDNLTSGKESNVNFKATFVEGDVRDEEDVRKAVRSCEAVFHLAALTDVRNADANENYQVNFLGSKNVFDAARSIKAKIIFTSSAAVYGDAKIPTNEDDRLKPISDYGKNKAKSEKIISNAFVLRMFNVYGPRGKSVVNKFCSNMEKYEKLTVYGDGLSTRDYIYIKDVVNALMLGLQKNGTYNVGTGTETTVLNIIEAIQKLTKTKPSIKFELPIESEIRRSRADITKIRRLGWSPKIGLEDGIRLVLDSLSGQ